jgi:hypothetical protein
VSFFDGNPCPLRHHAARSTAAVSSDPRSNGYCRLSDRAVVQYRETTDLCQQEATDFGIYYYMEYS